VNHLTQRRRDTAALISLLVDSEIDFIIGGGAAGRPKDLEAIAELEQILEERPQK